MLRAIEHRHAAAWPAEKAVGSLTLDYDNRHRRRIRLKTDGGVEVLLDLPKAVAMAHGDGLRLEDGRWLGVRAAPEALIEVRSLSATQLARIAWHIGNRHFPAQILEDAIRIRPDHVMEAMVARARRHDDPHGGAVSARRRRLLPARATAAGMRRAGQRHGHDHEAQGHGHRAWARSWADHRHSTITIMGTLRLGKPPHPHDLTPPS